MSHLSRYLLFRFTGGALALYLIAIFLVWLMQMLRLFDLITEKGQNLLTLFGQSLLTTPPLSRQIIYICMGIGLARALSAMQESHELHSIHSSGRIKAIWSALAVFSISGAVFALFISNWAEPVSRRAVNVWSAQIAVDLLSQNLTPGRFTQISDGVVVRIGGRNSNGIIEDFFADDKRDPDIRRTYLAERAEIVIGAEGYQISLRNGRLQAAPADGRYSEIEFARYDLAIESLTDPLNIANPVIQRSSFKLIQQGLKAGNFRYGMLDQLHWRFSEGPRVLALCLLIAALGAFPHGQRTGRRLPPELIVLIVAFSERSLSGLAANYSFYGYYLGPLVMLMAAGFIMIRHIRPAGWLRRKRNTGPAT